MRRGALLGLLAATGVLALSSGSVWLPAALVAAVATTWLLERFGVPLRYLAACTLLWSGVLGGCAAGVRHEGSIGLLLGTCAVVFWLGWFACGKSVEGSARWERLRAACCGAAPFAALAMAVLLLDAGIVEWDRSAALPLVLGILALGFAAGSGTFTSRHVRVGEKREKRARSWLAGPLLLALLTMTLAWLLLQGPLHAASENLIRWASSWSGVLPPPPGVPPPKGGDPNEAGESGNEKGAEGGERSVWERAELPMRGSVELEHVPEVLLDFPEEEVEAVWRNRTIHLRKIAMDRFADSAWQRAGTEEALYSDDDDGERDGVTWLGQRREGVIRYTIGTETEPGQPLPVLTGEAGFELDRIYLRKPAWYFVEQEGKLRYSGISAPVRLEDLPPDSVRPGSGGPVLLELPVDPWANRMRELVADIAAGADSKGEALERIRRYLWENTRYSSRIENPADLHPVENFLFHERRGYCDFYATAGVLMARALGMPSRIAFGFGGGEFDEKQGAFVFFADDEHAWAELYVEGVGWVIYDTTPSGSGGPDPAETMRGDSAEDWSGFADLREIQSRVRQEIAEESPWEKWRSLLAGITFEVWLGAALAVLALAWLARALRPRKKAAEGASAAEPEAAPRYLQAFYRLCGEWGYRRSRAQTLKEFLWGLKQEQLIGDEFDPMADYYYAVSYESADTDAGQERRWTERVRETRRRVGGERET